MDSGASPPTSDASAANDASPGPADDGPADGGPQPGPGGCKPIAIDGTTQVDNSGAHMYAWYDAQCKPRTAALIHNDATDGLGTSGGYLRRLSYVRDGQTRTCTGTGANGWNGFGFIVNHYGTSASDTQRLTGQHRVALAGNHHAIHEFKWRVNPGGPVDVTAHWLFATGRDHPLFSITFDSTTAGADVVKADTRAPYGDLGFDDDRKGDVSGVGWGDKYQFKTTGNGPVIPTSPWDYTQPNTVPYDLEWSNAADAEMGLVASEPWDAKVSGGDYYGGQLMTQWGKTGSSLLRDLPDSEWPYQLNQYELPFTTSSHRIAWGASYGAVGQTSYSAFGTTLSGYPFQSYAVYVVIGGHGAGAVAAAVHEIEVIQGTKLTASRGTVSTAGPPGVARTDAAPYALAGFDPVYAAWDVHAATNAATLDFAVSKGALVNPVCHVHDYGATAPPSRVTFAGKTLAANADYFASVDPETQSLWLTLNLTIGAGELTIDP
jgi:hypothetical protein